MDYAYFLVAADRGIQRTKRVSSYHRFVYHGIRAYANEQLTGWDRPALTNNNRELIHLSRSGTFVPSIFSPRWNELIVPAEFQAKPVFGSLEFQPIVLEQVVDLAMPALGKICREGVFGEREQRELLTTLPHRSDLQRRIAGHVQMLVPNLSSDMVDFRKVNVEVGNYMSQRRDVPISMELLNKYGVIYSQSGFFVVGEDQFTVIAPLLDLDYYAVGVLDLRRRTVFGPEGRRTVQWPEE